MAAAPGHASDSAVRDGGSGTIEGRPKSLTKEMARAAASEIVDDLANARLLEKSELEQSITDLASEGSSRFYVDGYALARDLENHCGWEPNLRMAEILDNYGSAARKQIEVAELEWKRRNNIQPQLTIGTRVAISQGEFGVITGIYKYGVAKYEVMIEGDADALAPLNARRIIKWEDAVPAPTSIAHGTETCVVEASKPI